MLNPVVMRIEHADGPLRPDAFSNVRAARASTDAAGSSSGKARSGPEFSDFLDTINPLQQLPIVGPIYRALTGDEISPEAHYAGSALYGLALGGPIGMGAMVGLAIAEDVVTDHFSSSDVAIAAAGNDDAAPRTSVDVVSQEDHPGATVVASGEEEIALATTDGTPLDLFQWLRPEATSAGFSIETVSEPFAPASVNDVAAHPNNHLPLSVLEALRQRHVGLLQNEQT
ncbi:hypothetical protein [Breoghania sp.]|uniref:hypothetical protein n=1 Tax=Breoghania sp. TaxID=2065378 RepID=UPI002AAB7D95|nr:hypothetical protein [Breoghania sp.]